MSIKQHVGEISDRTWGGRNPTPSGLWAASLWTA